jgi:serine/threonine protein kinase
MSCPDETSLLEYLDQALEESVQQELELHIDSCSICRKVIADIHRSSLITFSTPETLQNSATTSPRFLQTITDPASHNELQDRLVPGLVIAERFRLVRQLGFGAMGVVFLATDLQLNQDVAVKILKYEVEKEPKLMDLVRSEILLSRRISHPNVCRVYDLGVFDSIHFITMEFIQGKQLNVFMDENKLSDDARFKILVQICDALEAAHSVGVIHRDLKPSNIIVDDDLRVTVLDLGLARDLEHDPSRSGLLVGSPAYWSPEQAGGRRATERSDLFAVGKVGCELFGIRNLYFGEKNRLKGIPKSYRQVFERCLKMNPKNRYSSARRVREALKSAHRSHTQKVSVWKKLAVAVLVICCLTFGLWYKLSADEQVVQETANVQKQTNLPKITLDKDDNLKPKETPSSPVKKFKIEKLPSKKVKNRRRKTIQKNEKTRVSNNHSKAIDNSLILGRLTAFQEQLAKIEKSRQAKGFLLLDIPDYLLTIKRIRRALAKKNPTEVDNLLPELNRLLDRTKIDEVFISTKLNRMNKKYKAASLDSKANKQINRVFKKVHDSFFAGDYDSANTGLNEIWHMIQRP